MTAQVHERLVVDGEETSMAFCPPLPKKDSRVIKLTDDAIEKQGIFFSTACWRQYVGTWEIKDGRFYLVNLEGRYRLLSDVPILADWFTGTLRIPHGQLLHYVHMGFASVYEQETHIKVKKGIVTKSRVMNNRNKKVNKGCLGWKNLPGFENRFDGDREL